jgi:hypothetical protein
MAQESEEILIADQFESFKNERMNFDARDYGKNSKFISTFDNSWSIDTTFYSTYLETNESDLLNLFDVEIIFYSKEIQDGNKQIVEQKTFLSQRKVCYIFQRHCEQLNGLRLVEDLLQKHETNEQISILNCGLTIVKKKEIQLLEASDYTNPEFHLYDMTGRSLASGLLSTTETIDIEKLKTNTYFVVINDQNFKNYCAFKFLKE